MELIGQILSIIAMVIAILSYQAKTQKTFTAIQLGNTTLFAVSFLLLGATTGAMLNFIAAIRALIYVNKQKLRADRPIWLIGFSVFYVASCVMTFTAFGKPLTALNLIIEILPVIGMVASHLSLYINDDKAVRRFSLISSPVWLVYNIVAHSTGAIICESISLVSIFIGILRHDIDRKPKK